ISSPIFLRTVPDRKPRTECGCHSVAAKSCCIVAPSLRLSSSRIAEALLPSRVLFSFARAVGVFLPELAFFPDFPFLGATGARRAPELPFFLALGLAGVTA